MIQRKSCLTPLPNSLPASGPNLQRLVSREPGKGCSDAVQKPVSSYSISCQEVCRTYWRRDIAIEKKKEARVTEYYYHPWERSRLCGSGAVSAIHLCIARNLAMSAGQCEVQGRSASTRLKSGG